MAEFCAGAKAKLLRIKPVYISNTKGVPREFMEGVIDTVKDIVVRANVKLPVKYFGDFNLGSGPYGSADWYVKQTWNKVRNQINARELLKLMISEPFQQNEKHYDIFVTDHDLWAGDDENNFVCGLTYYGFGTVQSIARLHLNRENFNTITYHEMAHIFGTPNNNRKNISFAYGGGHCTDPYCSMQQSNIPGHPTIQTVTKNRIQKGNPYCADCLQDLRNYFGK